MKIPKRIQPLIDDGLVDEVLRQLMSGKEATVFMVRCGTQIRCAKVYKDVHKRSFKQAAQYQEGRKFRNSRQARAVKKRSRFGREQQEEGWQNAEVSALYRLADAGIRVPKAFGCFDGVLLMELITDADGQVAPRLSDVNLSEKEALHQHATMMSYVVRMLCVGLVHGDLSEFNVLVDGQGPVIIDLPQAIDASINNQAKELLERDINNITAFYSIFAPSLSGRRFADELWKIYEDGELHPGVLLKGEFEESLCSPDVDGLIQEIETVIREEDRRQDRLREEKGD